MMSAAGPWRSNARSVADFRLRLAFNTSWEELMSDMATLARLTPSTIALAPP